MGGFEGRDRTSRGCNRREALAFGGTLALGWLLGPTTARAALPATRSLSFYALHTGEELTADYCVDGRYQPQQLQAIARVLRDHRTDQIHDIDPAVLDIVHAVRRMVDSREAIHVVSGYRSPETNEMKRRQSRWSGVAKNSYHLYGQAIDVILPDADVRQVRRAGMALQAGGVGYYPRSGFVHLDCGPFRTW
jgi:uncharacterized protein YcbK (DUF882 family)